MILLDWSGKADTHMLKQIPRPNKKSLFKAEHQRYGLDIWRREIRLYGVVQMPDWKAKPEYSWIVDDSSEQKLNWIPPPDIE